MDIWEVTEGFTRREGWGVPDRMDGFVLMLISALRKAIRELDPKATVVVHVGFATDGHSKNSQHYKGYAIDFHFETNIRYDAQVDLVIYTLRKLQVHSRVGLGLYPDWSSPGFHIDSRGVMARWGYIAGVYSTFADTYNHALMKFNM
jgi:hypothetical protein